MSLSDLTEGKMLTLFSATNRCDIASGSRQNKDSRKVSSSNTKQQITTMENITGWASRMFMKNKMQEMGLPGQGDQKIDKEKQQAQEAKRKDLAEQRRQHEAEYAERKAAKSGKMSMADRWAANKAGK